MMIQDESKKPSDADILRSMELTTDGGAIEEEMKEERKKKRKAEQASD